MSENPNKSKSVKKDMEKYNQFNNPFEEREAVEQKTKTNKVLNFQKTFDETNPSNTNTTDNTSVTLIEENESTHQQSTEKPNGMKMNEELKPSHEEENYYEKDLPSLKILIEESKKDEPRCGGNEPRGVGNEPHFHQKISEATRTDLLEELKIMYHNSKQLEKKESETNILPKSVRSKEKQKTKKLSKPSESEPSKGTMLYSNPSNKNPLNKQNPQINLSHTTGQEKNKSGISFQNILNTIDNKSLFNIFNVLLNKINFIIPKIRIYEFYDFFNNCRSLLKYKINLFGWKHEAKYDDHFVTPEQILDLLLSIKKDLDLLMNLFSRNTSENEFVQQLKEYFEHIPTSKSEISKMFTFKFDEE